MTQKYSLWIEFWGCQTSLCRWLICQKL